MRAAADLAVRIAWRARALSLVVGCVALAALSGCSLELDGGADAEPSPSSATLNEMRDLSVRYNPIYWLGNSFRGLALTDAKLDGEAAVLSYGPSSCEPSGCTAPPLVISTFAGRQRHFFPPIDYPPAKRSLVCADDVRGGVLIQDCRNERHPSVQTGNFYTGGQYRGVGLEINHYIPHLTIAELARSVVPIEDEPGAPRGLPPPRPIPCESLEYLVRWWVEMVRRELGTLPSTCSGQ